MRTHFFVGCVTWCSLIGFTAMSQAQQIDRGSVAKYEVQTLREEGRVVGCSLTFHAMVAPTDLASTKVLYVPGALVYEAAGTRNLAMLKIGAFAVDQQNPSQSRPARNRPVSVRIGTESLRMLGVTPSTPDGYWVLALDPNEVFPGMAKIVLGQPLTIGWKREGFAFDHALELTQSAGERERESMTECIKAVMVEAEKTLKGGQQGR